MSWRVGVDTGGTFTDVALYNDETQAVSVVKVSSTPSDPGLAVLEGVTEALNRSGSAMAGFSGIAYFAHGTTVATNALLQERGARTALVTTAGFRDLLELGRGRRPGLYDLGRAQPTPLAPRDLRIEVHERMRHDGSVITPLDDDEVRAAAALLRESDVESVSVCFLYGYVNDAHEVRVRKILEEELPGVYLSIGHEVLPEFREFERLSTVVINGFIGPVMEGYLSRLRQNLTAAGLEVIPKVTQSNGGIMSFEQAERLPVRTLLSGPSTGVVGAARVCSASGIDNIITFDMGGTSSDVALVRGGTPAASSGMTLEGRPVRAPMLDINTVGAGGGSIAWVDDGGHLKVGPKSAGAFPGPACYGQGNDEATVTDANVVLGTVSQDYLLGGSMKIDADRSFRAVERLGSRIGLSIEDTASGIVKVVTASMARAIRVISVQRGYDPTAYDLVAFGGAGPLHSSRLAAALGMSRTVIPQRPGALSALGMLMTDLRSDFTGTRVTRVGGEGAAAVIARMLEDLTARATDWFDAEGISLSDRTVRRIVDARYLGQNYELQVEVPASSESSWLDALRSLFHEAHELRFGYSDRDAEIEVVTFRVEAIAAVPRVDFPRLAPTGASLDDTRIASRHIHFSELGGRVDVPVYDRVRLDVGTRIIGPAVIEQYDTTTLVQPDEVAVVDPFGLIRTQLSTGRSTSK